MNKNEEEVNSPGRSEDLLTRRAVLKEIVGVSIGVALASSGLRFGLAEDVVEPNALPPQKGDFFVFSDGAQKGKLVTSEALSLGGPQVRAWPAQIAGDPAAPTVNLVRDGNAQNLVLLTRFTQTDYKPDTKAYVTADGVCAYAATCTHQCCVVTDWVADQHLFHCPCHGSEFDPLNHAQQTPESPAPRPLPQLPLVLDQGGVYPTVAGTFRTAVGCDPSGH